MSNRNRRIGHNAERYYVNLFKELGFEFCVTARYGSRIHDDSKIDIINIPFNIQVKAGIQRGLNPARELSEMKKLINRFFPPNDDVHSKPCILIHKKNIGRGKRETEEHQIVHMSKKQYLEFKKLNKKFKYIKDKTRKKIENPEFRHMVYMTFEHFKNKILIKYANKI